MKWVWMSHQASLQKDVLFRQRFWVSSPATTFKIDPLPLIFSQYYLPLSLFHIFINKVDFSLSTGVHVIRFMRAKDATCPL